MKDNSSLRGSYNLESLQEKSTKPRKTPIRLMKNKHPSNDYSKSNLDLDSLEVHDRKAPLGEQSSDNSLMTLTYPHYQAQKLQQQ